MTLEALLKYFKANDASYTLTRFGGLTYVANIDGNIEHWEYDSDSDTYNEAQGMGNPFRQSPRR